MNKLVEICETKRGEVAERKQRHSLHSLDAKAKDRTPPRGFRSALECAQQNGFGLIADPDSHQRAAHS